MTTATEAFDVIILGAGAAGLMCALTAGQRGRKVLLLDHADRIGAKILISGGGRCNFTNLNSAPDCFLSGNTDFCKSALARYTQADFISLIERHCIPYHEKTLGQMFCNGSARAIVAMLLTECAQGGVDVRVGHTVTDISRADCFRLETSHGCFTASALVLATGGLSIPKMGATGFAYDVARRFGLRARPLFQRPWNLHELPHLFRRERGRDELILEGVGKHEIEAPHLIGPHRALGEEVVAPLTHELRRYLCELLVEQQRIIVGIHEINGVPIALHVASDRVFLRKRL
jgi:glycine/D-amino acid oxidase-like deaminating enzyme